MAGHGAGHGIIGMRERADSIGARLEIESAPGQGTTVRCRLHAGRTVLGALATAIFFCAALPR